MTTDRQRVGVVVNPEREELADEFVAGLRDVDGDIDVVVERVDDPSGLDDATRRLLDDGVGCIAAVGGDGTQRTVAAAIAGTDASLVIVPGGTVNLLGQVLGIETVDDAVSAATSGVEDVIDLGDDDGTVFTLNASSGWDASVIADAEDGIKRFGRLGFAVAGLRAWFRTRARSVEVIVDGDTWYDGGAVTVMVMNVGERASADFHLAPDARIDDGRLDVVVLRRHSFAGMVRSLVATAAGRRPPRRDVRTAQGAEIVVRWATPVDHQLDGDGTGERTDTTYRSRPDALRVRRPPSSID